MGQILHDWNLAVKRELLAKAHASLQKGGAFIVYDQMIDDGRRENAAGLLMSLGMLIRTQGGFDYTGADCIGWMREAGFTEARREHLCGPYSMVVGAKVGNCTHALGVIGTAASGSHFAGKCPRHPKLKAPGRLSSPGRRVVEGSGMDEITDRIQPPSHAPRC